MKEEVKKNEKLDEKKEEKKKRITKKKNSDETETQKTSFSLKVKKKEQQRIIIGEAISYHKKELDKWTKKQNDLNKDLKEEDWKTFIAQFSEEEIKKRLGL